VCYRDDFREVEGFGADEVPSKGEDIESVEGDADERDQVEVAGHMFKAARLQLPLSGETGMPIGKMRGALRGMWLEAIPRVYRIDREQKKPAELLSGKGFGVGPGSVWNPRGKKEVRAGVGELEREGLGTAREGPWESGEGRTGRMLSSWTIPGRHVAGADPSHEARIGRGGCHNPTGKG